jgi:Ni,Fe-hydrogenase III small subunit
VFVLLNELRKLRHRIALPSSPEPGSLAVRHVDAGSCNGCEHELSAGFGPHYDLGRHGLSVTASPRHADVLLVTGAITTRMTAPLRAAHAAMPEPRLVVALGNCACGRGLLGESGELAGPLEDILPVNLYIEGCPPSPDAIERSLIELIDLTKPGGAASELGVAGSSR